MSTQATSGAVRRETATRSDGATRIDLTSNEPSLGQLVASASQDVSTLVRSEMEMAKAELRNDVKHAIKGSAMFGAAGVLALLAVVLLSFAAAWGIVALGLHPGWAFLIVGAVYLLVAAVLGLVGKKQVTKVKPPERTIATTKETVAMLKSGGSARR